MNPKLKLSASSLDQFCGLYLYFTLVSGQVGTRSQLLYSDTSCVSFRNIYCAMTTEITNGPPEKTPENSPLATSGNLPTAVFNGF